MSTHKRTIPHWGREVNIVITAIKKVSWDNVYPEPDLISIPENYVWAIFDPREKDHCIHQSRGTYHNYDDALRDAQEYLIALGNAYKIENKEKDSLETGDA